MDFSFLNLFEFSQDIVWNRNVESINEEMLERNSESDDSV